MNSMTQDETYNGYANRETWAFNLHWQNDQGLYNETLAVARERSDDTWSDYDLGGEIVSYWRDFLDEQVEHNPTPMPVGLRMFDRDVGSWWRIDYAEVGAAVRESLDTES